MTDIHQWRRKIQPALVRTPAVDLNEGLALSPGTPRKGLMPKFSSYFGQHAGPPGVSKTDIASDEDVFSQTAWYLSWSSNVPAPSPDAERLMESVMSKLLAEPHRALDPRYHSMLMQIFESYRHLKDHNEQLQLQLDQENEKRETLEHALHHASQQWEAEKQDYKAEVKRLELILAQGKRGLAEVTLARQNSVSRHSKQQSKGNDDKMETIFEFLEKTKRYEDRAWGSQRATMRRKSPSTQMRRLSRSLTKHSSPIDAPIDIPFGKPPHADVCFLTERDDPSRTGPTTRSGSEAKTHVSDETLSTFSCAGDFLPDELTDVNLIPAAGIDNDFLALKRFANILARRRDVDPEAVMPKLWSLLEAQGGATERSSSLPTGLGVQFAAPTSADVERMHPGINAWKNPTLKVKASGFLSRFRPQLTVDTSRGTSRRFSFEAGDDALASLSAHNIDTLPPTVKDRLLRKSASMSSLEVTKAPALEPLLSPVAQSPTTTALPQEFVGTPPDQEDAKRTRIPTPTYYRSSSLAKPRREREDSASSLLTAIKVSRPVSQRSNSSSSYSSPSASRTDLTQGVHAAEATQGSGAKSNRLLHHTTSLRGGLAAVAAQKAANINLNNFDQQPAAPGQRKGTLCNNNRSSTRSHTHSDTSGPQKENQEPMNGSFGSIANENVTT